MLKHCLQPKTQLRRRARHAEGDLQQVQVLAVCDCQQLAPTAGCAAEMEDQNARPRLQTMTTRLQGSLRGADPLNQMSWSAVAPGALAIICRKRGWERRGDWTVNAAPTDRKTVCRLRCSVGHSGKTLVVLHRYDAHNLSQRHTVRSAQSNSSCATVFSFNPDQLRNHFPPFGCRNCEIVSRVCEKDRDAIHSGF